MVHQIIFSGHVSQSVPKQVEQESIDKIYKYCSQFGLTGFQLYTDGNFFCVLEGSKKAILALIDLYKGDSRLSDVTILLQSKTQHADFDDFRIGIHKNVIEKNIPHCFTITSETLGSIFSADIGDNTKILAKAFARVNNLMPQIFTS